MVMVITEESNKQNQHQSNKKSNNQVNQCQMRINDITCSICLDDFKRGDGVCHSSNCIHIFHHGCAEKWLLYHDECPCCRTHYLAPAKGRNHHIYVRPITMQNDVALHRTDSFSIIDDLPPWIVIAGR